MKKGIISTVNVIRECVGPRCWRKRKIRSMSGRTDTVRRRGRFALTLRRLDEPLPDRYPNAKWPIANVAFPSYYFASVEGDF
jgi:hypothetical protein